MAPSLAGFHFYGIIDTGYVRPKDWVVKCQNLLEGGADMIEFRAKNESPAECVRLVEAILPLFEKTTVPLIINDFIDLALAYPKLGLHVGQDDLDPRKARELLGPERILGLSTHSIEQARGAIERADVLNYFAVGPVYPTQTKPNYKAVGLKLISDVAALNPPLPFFAIGGVNRKTMHEVKAAGASRVVVVSDVLSDVDTASTVRTIRDYFKTQL